jgi:membrane-bound metal-dependent hydrolase YbcI (DUF457 family)
MKSRRRPEWGGWERTGLWVIALISTVAPDLDVIRNALFRGFFNHSTLWTHSLIVHGGILAVWWVLKRAGRWPYLQALVWLVAIGGLSHLLLDMIAHSTPLLYPFSMVMFGIPPTRVVEGGIRAYLTDPIFLLEPCLLTLAGAHWLCTQPSRQMVRTAGLIMLCTGLTIFIIAFLWFLPALQKTVMP